MEEINNKKTKSNIVLKILLSVLVCAIITTLTIIAIQLYKAKKVSEFIINNSSNISETKNTNKDPVESAKEAVLSSDIGMAESYLAMDLAKTVAINKEPLSIKGKSVELTVDNKLQNVGFDFKTIVAIGNTSGTEYKINMSEILSLVESRKDTIWVVDGEGKVSVYIIESGTLDKNPVAKKFEK